MDNKELDEILQKYVSTTKNDRDVAFEKLNLKPKETKPARKKFKPQYAFAIVMCSIAVVLCIVLPITLSNESPSDNNPIFCSSHDISYNVEESISVLVNECGVNAYYPKLQFADIRSISSNTDSSLKGALLETFIFDNAWLEITLVIIPKTHILDVYESYFTLPNKQQWGKYKLLYSKAFNQDTEFYDAQIYFRDEKYDYFITAHTDPDMEVTAILDIMYS